MQKIDKINNVLQKIDQAVECMWKFSYDVLAEIKPVILEINEVINELLGNVDKFSGYEIEIPLDVIVRQLQNMEEGMKYKDKILLADTLEYEIKQTLLFYKEILEAI